MIRKLSPWVFWPIFVVAGAIYTAMWTYGELGTVIGAPWAPACWAGSILGAVSIAALLVKRIAD